ncbi:hypothetical protein D3C87_1170220 [compost metagenome]
MEAISSPFTGTPSIRSSLVANVPTLNTSLPSRSRSLRTVLVSSGGLSLYNTLFCSSASSLSKLALIVERVFPFVTGLRTILAINFLSIYIIVMKGEAYV